MSDQPPAPLGPPPPFPPGLLSLSSTPNYQTTTQAVTPSSSTAIFSAAPTSILGNFNASKINKLHDRNWLVWKTHIATILKWKEVYEVAVGMAVRPMDPASTAAADWQAEDLIAQELITTAIKDEQVIHVSKCETAAQIWEALRIIHKPHGQ